MPAPSTLPTTGPSTRLSSSDHPASSPTGPSVDVAERVQERPVTADGDHERFAHIIRKDDHMKAYVLGEPVVALCGKKWVPSRDPERYPVCPTCKEVLAALRGGST